MWIIPSTQVLYNEMHWWKGQTMRSEKESPRNFNCNLKHCFSGKRLQQLNGVLDECLHNQNHIYFFFDRNKNCTQTVAKFRKFSVLWSSFQGCGKYLAGFQWKIKIKITSKDCIKKNDWVFFFCIFLKRFADFCLPVAFLDSSWIQDHLRLD